MTQIEKFISTKALIVIDTKRTLQLKGGGNGNGNGEARRNLPNVEAQSNGNACPPPFEERM